MKYVLLFCDTEERGWAALDAAGRERAYGEVGRWMAANAGKITHQRKLGSPQAATTVRLRTRDEPLVTDGPFVEGKEVISGYVEAEVADLDEALRLARTWPGCPTVEVRPAE
jgi:hypothetical protein